MRRMNTELDLIKIRKKKEVKEKYDGNTSSIVLIKYTNYRTDCTCYNWQSNKGRQFKLKT